MKWNNFEKNIKNNMNERSIAPSNETWNRLETMLTSAEKNKPKRLILWISVAASIIGITFIGIYTIFQHSNKEKNEVQLVVQEKTVKKDSLKNNTKIVDKLENELIITSIKNMQIATKDASKKPYKHLTNNQINNNINSKQQTINQQNEFALSTVIENEKTVNQENHLQVDPIKMLTYIENKEEIILKNKPIKVDANNLLLQVDVELSETFTIKALQSINKNYQNIKEVIASRNIKE